MIASTGQVREGRSEITGDELNLKQVLNMTFKTFGYRTTLQVNSLKEAVRFWSMYRDDEDVSSSDLDEDILVTRTGKIIAEMTYNGCVWRV